MSIFLMGVYDPSTFRWCTVTKCGNGLDDKMINKLQRELDVRKISKVTASILHSASDTVSLVLCSVAKDVSNATVSRSSVEQSSITRHCCPLSLHLLLSMS